MKIYCISNTFNNLNIIMAIMAKYFGGKNNITGDFMGHDYTIKNYFRIAVRKINVADVLVVDSECISDLIDAQVLYAKAIGKLVLYVDSDYNFERED